MANANFTIGHTAIMDWSRGASFDAAILPPMIAKYRAARDLLPAGPSRDTDDGKIAALLELQRTHARRTGAGEPPAIRRAPNARSLSAALKQGHPIGPTEGWRSADDVIAAARASARLDLRDKGIASPSPREVDQHARAKLQGRININASKYPDKRPRWLTLMRAAATSLGKTIRATPKGPKRKALFPRRAMWDRKSSAISAARKLARKRFGKLKRGADTDLRAAALLREQMQQDHAPTRAWWKASRVAVETLENGKAPAKASTRGENRRTNGPIPKLTESQVVDLVYEQKHEGRRLTDEEKIGIDNAVATIPDLSVQLPYRVGDRWEYEQRAQREAMAHIRRAEQGSRAELREAEAALLEVMRDNPALIAERIMWVLRGHFGYGEMKMAFNSLLQRGTRATKIARLTQLVGAFEWSVGPKRVTAVWKQLTDAQKQALDSAVWSEVESWARDEIEEEGSSGLRAAQAVGVTGTRVSKPGAPAPMDAKEAARVLRAQRKKNASDAATLADQFVNGDVPDDERLPLSRNKTERVVFPDRAVDIGELVAVEYLKKRPGVEAEFFIHKTERKPFPRVFVESEGTIELFPSPERQFNPKGTKTTRSIEVFDPEPTKFKPVPNEVADGGELTKVWVRVPRGTVDTDGKSLPFRVTEISFPANSRPRIDFTGDIATISYTRDTWAALPPSKRVMWQYQGHNPTTKAGHGF